MADGRYIENPEEDAHHSANSQLVPLRILPLLGARRKLYTFVFGQDRTTFKGCSRLGERNEGRLKDGEEERSAHQERSAGRLRNLVEEADRPHGSRVRNQRRVGLPS